MFPCRSIVLGTCLLGLLGIAARAEDPDSLSVFDGEGGLPVPSNAAPYTSLPDDAADPAPPSMFGIGPVPEGPPAALVPLLERPAMPVGWFADVQVALVKPHLSGGPQSGDLLSSTFANPFQPAVAPLDWAVMPRFELGYRLPEGHGEWLAGYRFVTAGGTETLGNFDAAGTGIVVSRLEARVLDLDHAFTENTEWNSPWVPPVFRITMGVRVAGVSNRSTVYGNQILAQATVNRFVGAGPRFALDTAWPIADTSVSFFTGFNASAPIGPNRQRFSQIVVNPDGTMTAASARSDVSVVAVPIIGVQAGFKWVPEWQDGSLRVTAGYLWERWFYLGQNTDSQSELTLQGPFVRGEIAF